MNAKELRKKFIDFFVSKDHAVIKSASLIPDETDPTVLFTTAGMHPLVPFLMGKDHSAGKRLVDYQKCIRTGDIDEVGDAWHLTFFEMLGNWSLNDFWKKEALGWSFEFMTKHLEIPVGKLAVSVFAGDEDAPFDEESFEIWKSLGIPEERIYKYNKKENWWGPAGKTGPCGPDSEMFYITDKEPCGDDCQPSCSCGKYVEIWNDVFMEYFKNEKGEFEKAQRKNVDTGMGLERVVAVLNGYSDAYQCDHIKPILNKIEDLSGKKYPESKEVTKAMRVVADHTRTATFVLGDVKAVVPSNSDQGYVLRRLIRRAVRYAKQLGIENSFMKDITQIVIQQMKEAYPELEKNQEKIYSELEKEELKFEKTIQKGMKMFENAKILDTRTVFDLYQTYGFPFEMTKELAEEKGLTVDEEAFKVELRKHQELSRTAAAGKFKGGLADSGEATAKLHTATHLLQYALRKVLGDHVYQKGSNITADRLRFDFSHPEKLTDEQKQEAEQIVNDLITQDLPVTNLEMSYDEAKAKGAIGIFEDKYGDKVSVYVVGDLENPVSMELCGGPHAKSTGQLGGFKIKKEQSSGSGVRRIKAILG